MYLISGIIAYLLILLLNLWFYPNASTLESGTNAAAIEAMVLAAIAANNTRKGR